LAALPSGVVVRFPSSSSGSSLAPSPCVCLSRVCPQFGARSPPASQPSEVEFIGSLAMTSFCTDLHLEHSNQRCSNPMGPGLVRASIMRDVQREQRGRLMDVPPEK